MYGVYIHTVTANPNETLDNFETLELLEVQIPSTVRERKFVPSAMGPSLDLKRNEPP